MQQQFLMEFGTLALVHLLAVISPGPNLVVVMRQSVCFGRRAALFTSVGVGAGILLHVAYSLLGIGLIISQSIVLFTVLKYLAAAYLIWMGVKALRAQPDDVRLSADDGAAPTPSARRAFITGFLTNGTNPKVTLLFLFLFSVVISPETPLALQVGYGCYMATVTTLWFCLMSMVFGNGRVRRGFQRMGHWFERVMGGVLVVLGLKIATAQS